MRDHYGPLGETPIVVDLDGTLLTVDTLDEGVATLLFGRPLKLLSAIPALARGRAAFKRAVSAVASVDLEVLPARERLLEWLSQRREEGAVLHLVTAADQSIADAIATRFGIFASAVGSSPGRNLKGLAKRDFLVAEFPDGFIYCGDSRADVPVFLASKGAVLCDAPKAAEAAVSKANIKILARFDDPRRAFEDVAKALRIHQWSKNVLVFVPLALGHVYMRPDAVLRSLAGFLILSLLASGTYLANDMADLAADRRHRSKRKRAFASGRVSLRLGFLLSPALTLLSLAAALALSPSFAAALLFYFVLTSLYSWKLKEIPLLDVLIIGTLFTSRLLMGAALLGLPQSIWLLSFSMFLFLSLALAKRHVEILAAAEGRSSISRRGYEAGDWPLSLTFGVSSGLVSVVIMLLFMTDEAGPSGLYRHSQWLFVIPAALMLWIMRIWLLSHRGRLQDDPVVFAMRDKESLALAAIIAIAFIAAI